MITKTLHVIGCFLTHVVEKRFIGRIQAASKHEILPDENAHLIAKFIEVVTLINTAAPHTKHVHVGIAHRLKQLAIFLFGNAARKTIGRNPVAAFGKDRHAIDHKGEAFAGIIALLPKLQTTQTSATTRFISKLAIDQQPGPESIKRMRAQPVGPPE